MRHYVSQKHFVLYFYSEPGFSKQGQENPGLLWSLILDLEALKENSGFFFFG